IAPPMFGVVMSWLSVMTVVTDGDLRVDLLRLLHSEQDMYFYRSVVPGDIVTSVAKIAAIEEMSRGESLTVEIHCTNQRDEPVQRILFTVFIRGKNGREKRGERSAKESQPSGEPLLRVRQTIDADQTYRYAQASSDYNPIHVDENVAKMAGLPGIIVHGLCTMAFTSKVVIDHLCNHDPGRLKRLRARFSRPVLPGQEITTAVWQKPDSGGLQVYGYETFGPEGKAVIKEGIAEVAEAN
ncbi:MAG: MaoC/PaaZ C-terminal domain-containing protein, partial [Candidatus Binatia bacterium]